MSTTVGLDKAFHGTSTAPGFLRPWVADFVASAAEMQTIDPDFLGFFGNYDCLYKCIATGIVDGTGMGRFIVNFFKCLSLSLGTFGNALEYKQEFASRCGASGLTVEALVEALDTLVLALRGTPILPNDWSLAKVMALYLSPTPKADIQKLTTLINAVCQRLPVATIIEATISFLNMNIDLKVLPEHTLRRRPAGPKTPPSPQHPMTNPASASHKATPIRSANTELTTPSTPSPALPPPANTTSLVQPNTSFTPPALHNATPVKGRISSFVLNAQEKARKSRPSSAANSLDTQSTPSMNTVSAPAATMQKLIRTEFSGLIYPNIPGFIEVYLEEEAGDGPGFSTPAGLGCKVNEMVMKEKLIGEGVLDQDGKWRFAGAGDDVFVDAFVKSASIIQNLVCSQDSPFTSGPLLSQFNSLAIASSPPSISSPQPIWFSTRNISPKNPSRPSQVRPDFVLAFSGLSSATVTPTAFSWSDILLVGEHNSRGSTPPNSFSQLLHYATLVFEAQPTRIFVHGIRTTTMRDRIQFESDTTSNPAKWQAQTAKLMITFWRIDRAGAIGSRNYLLSHPQDALLAVRGIAAYVRLTWKGWGFVDELFSPHHGQGRIWGLNSFVPGSGIMMNVPIGGEGKGCQWSWMGVQKCLFRQGGALGRGTTCFHVRRAVSQGDQEWNDSTALQRGTFKDYVVKMTFRNRSRRVGEQEFFEKANAAGDVPGLAKFISSSRVAKFDIIEDVRKGVSGTTGRGVSFDDLDDLWNGGVDAPTGKEETQGQVDPCGIDRVLTLLVLGTVGTPVREAATPIQLLHGIFACLLAHATLYFESGILHRDISYQNILFTSRPYPITRAIPSIHGLPPMAPSVLYGCLIDLDYATHYHPSESLGETKHRTGTLPFMAVEILTTAGIKHRYVHDVQSFMLVLVWCCVDVNGPGAMGPKGEVTEAQKLAAKRIYKWNEMDRGEEDVGSRKELDLVKDERWGEILAGFRSGFELGGAMARLAGGLRDLLFPVMERHGQKPVRSQADFDEGEEELGLFTAVRDLVWEALRELADGEQQASG